jgi:hypothetical protein
MLARVLKMFGGDAEAITDDDLSDPFKAQVSYAMLKKVAAQIRGGEGVLKLTGIEEGATERSLIADVTGEKKGTPFKLHLSIDDHDKIVGLLIQPGADKRVPELKSWDDLKERLAAAAESSAFTLEEVISQRASRIRDVGGPGEESKSVVLDKLESRVALSSDKPLAIGSAFKLWVLTALAEAVEAGDAKWDEKLKIQDAIKSLPSGVMQDQEGGKEFTLREFAEKMISISDNTATDHLIHHLGRDRCERAMARSCMDHAEANKPFLTTRDLFVLKLSGSDALPKKYMEAGTDSRRAMLPDLAKQSPQILPAMAWKAPRFIDRLEWFASGQDMARTLVRLDALSRTEGLEPVRAILSINPGLPIDKKVFPYIAFKGGSEPGVLSLNWLLERSDGKRFVLAFTLNDTKKAIDESLGIALAQRAIELLGKGVQVRETDEKK